MSLDEALFKYGMKDRMNQGDKRAAMLFSRFRKFELTKVYRQDKGEEKLTKILDLLRYDARPMEKVLPMLRESILTKKDLEDPKWEFAPTVVTGNRERKFINEVTAPRYSIAHGTPLLVWNVQYIS